MKVELKIWYFSHITTIIISIYALINTVPNRTKKKIYNIRLDDLRAVIYFCFLIFLCMYEYQCQELFITSIYIKIWKPYFTVEIMWLFLRFAKILINFRVITLLHYDLTYYNNVREERNKFNVQWITKNNEWMKLNQTQFNWWQKKHKYHSSHCSV